MSFATEAAKNITEPIVLVELDLDAPVKVYENLSAVGDFEPHSYTWRLSKDTSEFQFGGASLKADKYPTRDVIEKFESLENNGAFSAGANLRMNYTNFTRGSGAIEFDKTGTTSQYAGVQLAGLSKEELQDIHEGRQLAVDIYIPAAYRASVTNYFIQFVDTSSGIRRWETSGGANADPRTGWQTVVFDLSFTADSDSLNWYLMDYVALGVKTSLTTTLLEGIIIDNFRYFNGPESHVDDVLESFSAASDWTAWGPETTNIADETSNVTEGTNAVSFDKTGTTVAYAGIYQDYASAFDLTKGHLCSVDVYIPDAASLAKIKIIEVIAGISGGARYSYAIDDRLQVGWNTCSLIFDMAYASWTRNSEGLGATQRLWFGLQTFNTSDTLTGIIFDNFRYNSDNDKEPCILLNRNAADWSAVTDISGITAVTGSSALSQVAIQFDKSGTSSTFALMSTSLGTGSCDWDKATTIAFDIYFSSAADAAKVWRLGMDVYEAGSSVYSQYYEAGKNCFDAGWNTIILNLKAPVTTNNSPDQRECNLVYFILGCNNASDTLTNVAIDNIRIYRQDYKDYGFISNARLDTWRAGINAAPTNFTLGGGGGTATVHYENKIKETGHYSCNLTRNGTDCYLYQAMTPSFMNSLSTSYRARIYCETASAVRLAIYNGSTRTYSSYHTGSGWETLDVPYEFGASPSAAWSEIRIETTDCSAYIDWCGWQLGSSYPLQHHLVLQDCNDSTKWVSDATYPGETAEWTSDWSKGGRCISLQKTNTGTPYSMASIACDWKLADYEALAFDFYIDSASMLTALQATNAVQVVLYGNYGGSAQVQKGWDRGDLRVGWNTLVIQPGDYLGAVFVAGSSYRAANTCKRFVIYTNTATAAQTYVHGNILIDNIRVIGAPIEETLVDVDDYTEWTAGTDTGNLADETSTVKISSSGVRFDKTGTSANEASISKSISLDIGNIVNGEFWFYVPLAEAEKIANVTLEFSDDSGNYIEYTRNYVVAGWNRVSWIGSQFYAATSASVPVTTRMTNVTFEVWTNNASDTFANVVLDCIRAKNYRPVGSESESTTLYGTYGPYSHFTDPGYSYYNGSGSVFPSYVQQAENNLLSNWKFNVFSGGAFTSWTHNGTGSLNQVTGGTTPPHGPNNCWMTSAAAVKGTLRQDISPFFVNGDQFTFGCWVGANAVAPGARLEIRDQSDALLASSSYHSGSGITSWEWLSCTATIVAGVTSLRAYLVADDTGGAGSLSAYFDGAVFVSGSAITPEFIIPPFTDTGKHDGGLGRGGCLRFSKTDTTQTYIGVDSTNCTALTLRGLKKLIVPIFVNSDDYDKLEVDANGTAINLICCEDTAGFVNTVAYGIYKSDLKVDQWTFVEIDLEDPVSSTGSYDRLLIRRIAWNFKVTTATDTLEGLCVGPLIKEVRSFAEMGMRQVGWSKRILQDDFGLRVYIPSNELDKINQLKVYLDESEHMEKTNIFSTSSLSAGWNDIRWDLDTESTELDSPTFTNVNRIIVMLETNEPTDELEGIRFDYIASYLEEAKTYRFSFSDIVGVTNAKFWEGRLLKGGSVTRQLNEKRGLPSVSNQRLQLIDTDFFFSNLYYKIGQAPAFRNKSMLVKLGFEGLAESEFEEIYRGYIADFDLNRLVANFTIKDLTDNYFDRLPTRKIDPDVWTNVPDDNRYKPCPVIYGDVEGDGTNGGALPTINLGKYSHPYLKTDVTYYLVAGHVCKAGTAVVWLKDEDTSAYSNPSASQYTVDYAFYASDGLPYTIIGALGVVDPFDGYEVTVDIQGKTQNGDPYGVLLEDVIDCFEDLLVNEVGLPSTLIDTTSFAETQTLLADRNQEMAGAIVDDEDVKTIISEILVSHNFDIYVTKDGKFAVNVFVPRKSDPDANIITDETHVIGDSFDIKTGCDTLVNRIIYQSQYNYATGEFLYRDKEEDEDSVNTAGQYHDWESGTLDMKWIRVSSQAQAVAVRLLNFYRRGRPGATLRVPLNLIDKELTGRIKITHYQGAANDAERNAYGSGWHEHLCRIKKMQIDLDKKFIELEVDNLQDLADDCNFLGDRVTFTNSYTIASADEQTYMYLADRSTGKFSNGDDGHKLC